MRHRVNSTKLGLTSQHRDAMLANIVSDLIIHGRIKTTIAKAKAVRPLAEKLVTLGKKGTLHHRRLAIAKIKQPDAVKKLFTDVAPQFADRVGGYVRITKLGPRDSDASMMAFLEWTKGEPVTSKKNRKAAGTEKAATKTPAKTKAPAKSEVIETTAVEVPSTSEETAAEPAPRKSEEQA